MGGHGSGRWGHYSRRATTRECRVLDTFSLAREGILRGGVCESSVLKWININYGELRWTIQVEVDTRASVDPTIRLKYTVMRTGEQFDYPVYLKTTVPTYGGLKWWFTCPLTCGRRVRKLFIAPGSNHFSCRHCHDLSYASRNSCKYTALFKAQAIRVRLGGSASICDPFPPKPKGMWETTYQRLWEQEGRHYASHVERNG